MKNKLTLIIFTLMNFVSMMTASIFNGILDKVAIDLNVTVALTGLLNSAYAFGAAIGVPIVLILFFNIEKSSSKPITNMNRINPIWLSNSRLVKDSLGKRNW